MPENPSTPAPLPSPAKTFAEPNHQKQSEQALEHEEVRLREEQIAELTLTDPLEAERMIVDGELKDNVAGTDEDS